MIFSAIIAAPFCLLIWFFLGSNPDPGGQNDEGFVPLSPLVYPLLWLGILLGLWVVGCQFYFTKME